MENTTAQEKVTTHCHACFDKMEVSAEKYQQEEAKWGRRPRFYCSSSCLHFDLF